MSDLLAKLSAPFPPARISWRVGSTTQAKDKGMALAYIDSRDVQDRLDQVCGAEWQCRYPHAGQKTVCEIGIKVNDTWVWKADGAGDSDVEAEKGALSDAFKRAAVKWGIGRYLYDLDSPWVKIVARGKSYVIDEGEFARLQKLLPGSKAATAAPEAANVINATADQPKNAPGISKARTWVNTEVRDMNGCAEPDDLMEHLASTRANWVRCCREFPGLWTGPDGSGLRGEGVKIATIFNCRPRFDAFLKDVEAAAVESQQAAAE